MKPSLTGTQRDPLSGSGPCARSPVLFRRTKTRESDIRGREWHHCILRGVTSKQARCYSSVFRGLRSEGPLEKPFSPPERLAVETLRQGSF